MRPLPARTLRFSLSTLACSLASALLASPAWAGWENDINYGGTMSADIYVPDSPAESPAVIVSIHYCSGNKNSAKGWFLDEAENYGYYIIAPDAGGNCFDANAERGGQRGEIVAMVEWAIANHGVDPARVYASGASSGACMTQALLAAYPEVFAAGSSLAGVPAGAWTGTNTAFGLITPFPNQSAEAWGDVVRNINPGFTGPWPRIQIWHGEGDTTLSYDLYWPAETDQWTNVWGFNKDEGTEEQIQPPGANDTWTRMSYFSGEGEPVVETNHTGGLPDPHNLMGRGLWSDVVRFFDPNGEPRGSGTGGSGGTDGAGGAVGDGGTDGAGGAVGAGGSDGAGGAVSAGGSDAVGAGGSNVGGGMTSVGGSGVVDPGPSTGGADTGGTTSSSGGSSTVDPGTDPSMGDDSNDKGGCSYGSTGTNRPSPLHWAGMLLMLGGLLSRRRRA